jgi:hypothetical protein
MLTRSKSSRNGLAVGLADAHRREQEPQNGVQPVEVPRVVDLIWIYRRRADITPHRAGSGKEVVPRESPAYPTD